MTLLCFRTGCIAGVVTDSVVTAGVVIREGVSDDVVSFCVPDGVVVGQGLGWRLPFCLRSRVRSGMRLMPTGYGNVRQRWQRRTKLKQDRHTMRNHHGG